MTVVASVGASDWLVKGVACSADLALFAVRQPWAGSQCESTRTRRDRGQGQSQEEGSDVIDCSHGTCH